MARFRWYQGRFRALEPSTVWALDNVYIGMQCKEHCNGHGMCVHGLFCQCDEGYEGEMCAAAKLNPKFFKEDFDGIYRIIDNNINNDKITINRNRNLQTSKAPLKSQAQGTSLFTRAASNHRGRPKDSA